MQKTCCDAACAYANACVVGGKECSGCGDHFCGYELNDDGHCARCEAAMAKEGGEE